MTPADLLSYAPGDELIYREREAAPSERVLLIGREQKKRSPRVEVEFTEGERAGTRMLVPGNRVYGLWRDVDTFDAHMTVYGGSVPTTTSPTSSRTRSTPSTAGSSRAPSGR